MYSDNVKADPTCVGDPEFILYCVSPAVRSVLACNNLEGDTEAGSVVDKLAPDVVIARLMSGTASSKRVRSFLMSWII